MVACGLWPLACGGSSFFGISTFCVDFYVTCKLLGFSGLSWGQASQTYYYPSIRGPCIALVLALTIHVWSRPFTESARKSATTIRTVYNNVICTIVRTYDPSKLLLNLHQKRIFAFDK